MSNAATIDLVAKDARFQRVIAKNKALLQTLRTSMMEVSATARNMLLIGGGALAGFVKIASDFEETFSKFKAVFKEQSDAAESWVKVTADAMQRSRVDLMGYMATLQDTFVPFGFARDRALELSKTLTTLGVDLASFNNMADTEVMQLLTSALVGNHEAVRRFGISITAATLDMKLMEMGYEKVTRGATEQQKVLARLALIQSMSTDAQGDAIRTAGSFANQLKGLMADVKEVANIIGTGLIPPLKEFITKLRDQRAEVEKGAAQFADFIVEYGKWIGLIGGGLIVLPRFTGLLVNLTSIIGGAGSGLGRFVVFLNRLGPGAFPAIAAITLLIGEIISVQKEIYDLHRAMADMSERGKETGKMFDEIREAKRKFNESRDIKGQITALEELLAVQDKLRFALINDTETSYGAVMQLNAQIDETAKRLKRLRNELQTRKEPPTEAVSKYAKEIEKLTKSLEDQLAQMVLTDRQYILHKAGLEEATEAEVRHIHALLDKLESYEREDKAIAQAKKQTEEKAKQAFKEAQAIASQAEAIRDMLMTEDELYAKRVRELEVLEKAGELSREEVERAKELYAIEIKKKKEQQSTSSLEGMQAAWKRIAAAVGGRRSEEITQINRSEAGRHIGPDTSEADKATHQKLENVVQELKDANTHLSKMAREGVGTYGA